MPQYRCPRCHNLFEWPNNVCPHCGMKITLAVDKAKPLYCSDCGAELYEGKTFCPSCGSDQSIREVKRVEVVEVTQNTEKGGHVPLILGSIASYISWFCFNFFYVFGFMALGSLILGLIATIMGAIRYKRSGAARTGMILGIISMGVSTVALILFIVVIVLLVLFLTKVWQ